MERKSEEITGGHSNRYMYRHSGTEKSDETTNTTNTMAQNLRSRWVINMSKTPLMEAQENLLAHGPNFAITPRSPPIGEYVAAVEQICQKMAHGEAEQVRAEVKAVLKKVQHPKTNITRAEQKALSELKKDNNRVILTADKGTCLVVMDKEEYINKSQDLLNEDTYRVIPEDPTNKQKNRLIL